MRAMFRRLMLASLAVAHVAAAQTPDEEWNTLPGQAPAATPPSPPSSAPGEPAPPGPAPTTAGTATSAASSSTSRPTISSPRPVLEPNTVSMFGARSLGQWTRGQMIYLGFPLLGLRLSLGVSDRVDVGIGYDSFYFMMNEPRLTLRYNFYRGSNWAFAAQAEGGWAFFQMKASADIRGPRWLTGRRNGNFQPGFIVSYQGDHPRAARLFLSLSYMLTFDTEPYQKDPLGGVPSSLVLGHNGQLRAGAEMPLSAKTSFVFLLGLDAHGRPEDSLVMPWCSVGLVTSI